MCELLTKCSQKPISVSAAMQYLGITLNIMRNWVAYNFEEGMSWDNLGTVWKLELVPVSRELEQLATEKDKYDTFNWRRWCPTRIGAEAHNLYEKSVAFLSS